MSSLYFTLFGNSHSRPVLVLIHGAGGSRLSWPPALRRMPEVAVYTLDLPGHGRSAPPPLENIADYAAAIASFMDAMHLPPSVLVGHSMGSAIALTLALEHPAQVRGLVLIGSGARLRVHPSLLEWTAQESTLPQAIQTLLEWGFSPES
ncbi:MAG: alpha/beta fold hydrolase, partial [Anaerolineales bacterium]